MVANGQRPISALLLAATTCCLLIMSEVTLPAVDAQITFSRDWSPAGKRSSSSGTLSASSGTTTSTASASAECNVLLVKHVLPQMAYVNEICNSRSLDAAFQNRK